MWRILAFILVSHICTTVSSQLKVSKINVTTNDVLITMGLVQEKRPPQQTAIQHDVHKKNIQNAKAQSLASISDVKNFFEDVLKSGKLNSEFYSSFLHEVEN